MFHSSRSWCRSPALSKEKLGETPALVRHGAGEQDAEVERHAGHGRGFEQIGAEGPLPDNGVGGVAHVHHQLEFRGLLLPLDAGQGEARKPQGRERRVLHLKKGLEQRRAAGIPPDPQLGHQTLERQVLPGEGVHRPGPHPGEEIAEGWIARQIGAQGEGVDKEPDQVFQLAPPAVGDGRAHDQVVLARVAVQERLEDGQQDHEGSRAVPLAKPAKVVHRDRRRLHRPAGAAQARHRRAAMVRGQVQLRRTREALLPPGELRVEDLAGEVLALPFDEVEVLDGQLGKRRRPALGKRGVEGRHLAHEHAQGPGVAHLVVHGEGDGVLAGVHP